MRIPISHVNLQYFLYCFSRMFGCEMLSVDQTELSAILFIEMLCNVWPPFADPSCNVHTHTHTHTTGSPDSRAVYEEPRSDDCIIDDRFLGELFL